MAQAWQVILANASRKLVLVKLADNANDEGLCWPSYNYLAAQCEMDRRTVMRHIDDLILSGFLTKKHRKGGLHFNKSNMFQLTINEGDISTLKAAKEALKLAKKLANKNDKKTAPSDNLTLGAGVAEDHPTSGTGSPDLVILTTRPSGTGSPRTIIEPSMEPSIEPSIEPSCPKQAKKPDYIHEIFNHYPAHRRGGTDAQLWRLWKQEKLGFQDAIEVMLWLHAASQSDPQWSVDANGQFVQGLTKFIRERLWLTPVPVTQERSGYTQPANFHSGDTKWAEDLGEL